MQKKEAVAKANAILKTWPLSIILLPLFFVFHGVKENFGFILARDYIPLLLLYCLSSVLFFLLFYWMYRNRVKAALLTFVLLSLFLFYGAIEDFLKLNAPSVSRYSILVPSFLLFTIVFGILLRNKNHSFLRLNFFINLLLIVYVLFDVTIITSKSLFPASDKFSVYPFARGQSYNICKDCEKPDIYFLLFDEYASSKCLKNDLGFDNSKFDSFLLRRQFRIQPNSVGNYNFTPFSMSSILNMSFINGINREAITSDDYARCNKLIRENEVIKYLSASGYNILNYSIFDLAGNPSPINQEFLPLKARLITDRTLWGRMEKEILWHLFTGKFELKWLTKKLFYARNSNNNKLIDLVKEEAQKKSDMPRFVYAHFNMPHPPYYFDKGGKPNDKALLDHKYDKDHALYVGYVQYTNIKIQEMVNTIMTNSNGKAIIMVMGDHGFRNDSNLPHHVFLQNQNAVYLPQQDYKLFYDSLSGVNQFRVLFNTVFKQNLPLLSDSTSFLIDAN